MLGFDGSIARSPMPVESFRKRIFFQLLPPSVVLNTPRSAFGPHTWPSAPTYATSGFLGLSTMRAICCVSLSPSDVHVRPPSVVFHMPSPCDTLPRIGLSPPPTYTMSGLLSLTAIAPIVPPKYASVTGNVVTPPSVVFHTPPPVVPK